MLMHVVWGTWKKAKMGNRQYRILILEEGEIGLVDSLTICFFWIDMFAFLSLSFMFFFLYKCYTWPKYLHCNFVLIKIKFYNDLSNRWNLRRTFSTTIPRPSRRAWNSSAEELPPTALSSSMGRLSPKPGWEFLKCLLTCWHCAAAAVRKRLGLWRRRLSRLGQSLVERLNSLPRRRPKSKN